ncbi:protein GLUTELIN PRECURSOR ACCUMULATION 3-like isoform X1 [Cucumis sativus]|uniref:protein GLUTELIN PRECURSOR ACCUMULATION 3-like isoform X1 n=1 Tax=Cucumis sativus TaxID=3659 RepID=UPI0012F47D21|nr:protein GLUTELIN PRECURSOR ACCUMULATION 3-like isoform X1 [Cucumis sativus]XP_031744811.1 protein GLUTELIN PRECURSOR ACCUMULATION 3-like isoform X1 [Cucumis sativus]
MDDKEFLNLAYSLSEVKPSISGRATHIEAIEALRSHWRNSNPRLIPLKELGPLLRDYQRLITHNYFANDGPRSEFISTSLPGKDAYQFYHINDFRQLLGKQAYFFFIHVCFGDIDRSGCGLLDGQSFSPFAFALKLSFQCTLSVTTGFFFLENV